MSYFVINGAKVQRILFLSDFFYRNMLVGAKYLVPFAKRGAI